MARRHVLKSTRRLPAKASRAREGRGEAGGLGFVDGIGGALLVSAPPSFKVSSLRRCDVTYPGIVVQLALPPAMAGRRGVPGSGIFLCPLSGHTASPQAHCCAAGSSPCRLNVQAASDGLAAPSPSFPRLRSEPPAFSPGARGAVDGSAFNLSIHRSMSVRRQATAVAVMCTGLGETPGIDFPIDCGIAQAGEVAHLANPQQHILQPLGDEVRRRLVDAEDIVDHLRGRRCQRADLSCQDDTVPRGQRAKWLSLCFLIHFRSRISVSLAILYPQRARISVWSRSNRVLCLQLALVRPRKLVNLPLQEACAGSASRSCACSPSLLRHAHASAEGRPRRFPMHQFVVFLGNPLLGVNVRDQPAILHRAIEQPAPRCPEPAAIASMRSASCCRMSACSRRYLDC